MVTIQHLEVQFDVHGDDDEQLFIQYFNKYIDRWSQQKDAQRRIRDGMCKDRELGDRDRAKGH